VETVTEREDGEGSGSPPGGARERSNYARYLSRRATGTDRDEARADLHRRNAEDLFTELSKLRGTALKLAQGLSMEPGVLPTQFADILSKAQYEVPAMGPALVHRLVTQAFGMPPTEAFAEFNLTAMAAASLGQVHRARMHDGTDVVVKVQYPNVRESVDSDLRMVRALAGRFVDPDLIGPYVEEVRERMMEETDYLNEGRNIEQFAARYAGSAIVTPRWVESRTTERVLTMTFLEGRHLKAFLATEPTQERRNHFGQLLWDTVHEQVASDHLAVHADPHPGNFLFRDDGTLGILDFGCIKVFPRTFRDHLLDLYRARMAGDDAAQLRAYEALEMIPADLGEDERAYLMDVLDVFGGIIQSMYTEDTYDFGSGQLLSRFQEIMPRLTGREAFKHRRPVGSHHFVFVNRLLVGLLSMMTQLGAEVDVRHARVCLQ
jgi:predicted unusual protein kinase regulating ubiquinone biosynthesis (AarF/ABC1/UbiB family)